MSRKRSIGARIGQAIVLAFLGLGGYFIYFAVMWFHKFDVWAVEEPVCIRLDLSRSEAGQAPFHQTCSVAHAQSVALRPVRSEDAQEIRSNADRAHIKIHVNKGGDFASLEGPMGRDDSASSIVEIERIFPVRNGDYVFSFETTGVPELAGVPVDLIVRNELCGLEKMPGFVGSAVGGLLVFVGLVMGLILFVVRADRRGDEVAAATPSPLP